MGSSSKKISVTVSNDIVTDQRMARICTSLVKLGYDVEIIGRQLQNSLPLDNTIYKTRRLRLWFTTGPMFYLELNIRLFVKLSRHTPSIVYTVDADTALAGILAKKILKTKLIYDSHELFSEVPELIGQYIKKSIWRAIEKRIIRDADQRITVTDSIANHYSSVYGANFMVVRNFSIKKLRQKNNTNEKYILYQGALNKGRGLEELIKSADGFDIKIKIAGHGDMAQTLKKLANDNSRIEFLGKLSPTELEILTADAWLGYNLLEDSCLSYRYSLSNKTFDYIQAGIPQLLPKLIEYETLNKEWIFGLATSLNSDSIICAVTTLLEKSELYATLCQNALKASECLVWDKEEPILKVMLSNLRIQ